MPLLRSFQDFAEEALPTPRWLVDGLLPGDGWTILCAKAKTGKSLLAMQLAAALAIGGEFLGRSLKPTRVAYIQLDAPPGDWQEQVRRLPGPARLLPLTATRQDLPLYILDAVHVGPAAKLREALKAAGVEFVIWDALEKLTKQDLNTKEGCQLTLDRLRVVHSGPSLVVHHPRKPHGDSMDSLIDAVAGNHYLVGDASAIWGLVKTGEKSGSFRALTRASDETLLLEREPETYLWRPATSKPQAPENEKKYEW